MAKIEPITVYNFQTPLFGYGLGILLDKDQGVIGDMTDVTGIWSIERLIEHSDLPGMLKRLRDGTFKTTHDLSSVKVLAPVGLSMPVWAAGVTFKRSVDARRKESGSDIYDKVYSDPRPELFPKAFPGTAVHPGDNIGIRPDSEWNVPEPELVLIFNSKGELVAMTAGNDVSSRAIEGCNPLYLPQAKIYNQSCAIGSGLVFGLREEDARQCQTRLEIIRNGEVEFDKTSTIGNMKRTFTELRDHLFQPLNHPNGVALFTGTDLVPPDRWTLQEGDLVRISISGITALKNTVKVIPHRELSPIEPPQN